MSIMPGAQHGKCSLSGISDPFAPSAGYFLQGASHPIDSSGPGRAQGTARRSKWLEPSA